MPNENCINITTTPEKKIRAKSVSVKDPKSATKEGDIDNSSMPRFQEDHELSFGDSLRRNKVDIEVSNVDASQTRKVKFMINDKLVGSDQVSIEQLSENNSIFDHNSEDNEDKASNDKDAELDNRSQDSKQELYLDELASIDKLYEQIETEIQSLATRENKEVDEIEALLEAAAEADGDVGTGGLEKIVERDDEGGGEQAEDEDDTLKEATSS